MAGMLDNMKDKMGDMDDAMRERYEMLKSRAQEGNLDDQGRAELEQLRSRIENRGKQ